jgi:hypothetical protein
VWFVIYNETYTGTSLIHKSKEPVNIQFLPPPLTEKQQTVQQEQCVTEAVAAVTAVLKKQMTDQETAMQTRLVEIEKYLSKPMQ